MNLRTGKVYKYHLSHLAKAQDEMTVEEEWSFNDPYPVGEFSIDEEKEFIEDWGKEVVEVGNLEGMQV